jgi:cobaltochelatase CobN
MRGRRYSIAELPETSDALMQELLRHGTYDDKYPLDPAQAKRFSRAAYRRIFATFPEPPGRRMQDFWGQPQDRGFSVMPAKKTDKKLLPTIGGKVVSIEQEEPWGDEQDYLFAALDLGNALIALQPPRGYGIDPDAIYHTPDLPPTHHYAAFYRWLGTSQTEGGWGADAIVHMGKHGTLEWLPGKGMGLSGECFPDLLLGDLPLVYPFIINDPGEGANRSGERTPSIVDHLTPPMTTAETYGPLAELNQLVNEYYAVEKLDPVKLPYLQQQIWELVERTNLKADLDTEDDAHPRTRRPQPRVGRHADARRHSYATRLDDRQRGRASHRRPGRLSLRAGHGADSRWPSHSRTDASAAGDASFLDAVGERRRAKSSGEPRDCFRLRSAELLDKPGERLEPSRELFGHACYTHADVLELLDRASLDLFHDARDSRLSQRSRSPKYSARCSALSRRDIAAAHLRLCRTCAETRTNGRRDRPSAGCT